MCCKDWAAFSIANSQTCTFPSPCNFFGKFDGVIWALLSCFSVEHQIPAQPGLGFDCHFSCWQLFAHGLNFEGEWHEKLNMEHLHCSFHFGYFAIVCFNKSLRECSILSEEFRWGMSNPRSVSGQSVNTLLCLKPVDMESNGLVKAVPTHTGM